MGAVRADPVFRQGDPARAGAALVTFEPGRVRPGWPCASRATGILRTVFSELE